MRFAVPFAFVLALCTALPALAQDAPAPHEPPPEALAFYQHGRDLYRQGRYREAAAELERALTLDPSSPNLVYNVARVHELLGELPDAIRYYQRYLALLPHDDAEERERTQSTIQRLEGAQSELGTHAPPPPPPRGEQLRDVGPEVHVEHGVADEAFWATLLGSGVALLGASVCGILALVYDHNVATFAADGVATPADRQALIDEVHGLALATDVLFGVAAVGALSAAFLYFLRDRIEVVPRGHSPADDATASLVPLVSAAPGGLVLGLGGSL